MNKLQRILLELRKIDEEFIEGLKSKNGKYREIYVNPNREEINQIIADYDRDNVRFLADKGKNEVYVAAADVLHNDLADKLGDSRYKYMQYMMNAFPGNGKVKSGKIVVTRWTDLFFSSDDEDLANRLKELLKEILNGEYDWMEKYSFDLKEIKREAKEELK